MIGGKEGDKAERKWRIEENGGGEMMMKGEEAQNWEKKKGEKRTNAWIEEGKENRSFVYNFIMLD